LIVAAIEMQGPASASKLPKATGSFIAILL